MAIESPICRKYQSDGRVRSVTLIFYGALSALRAYCDLACLTPPGGRREEEGAWAGK